MRSRSSQFITEHGASFFEDIVEGTTLLRTQVEQALGELVAQGLVNADSFGGLRALLVPSDRRRTFDGQKRLRRTALFGIEDAGRWALVRRKPTVASSEGASRYPMPRSSSMSRARCCAAMASCSGGWSRARRQWLPPWRDLLRCYRRLEARGEIRGGRFVAGLSGEQFAAPEAIGLLRDMRRRESVRCADQPERRRSAEPGWHSESGSRACLR